MRDTIKALLKDAGCGLNADFAKQWGARMYAYYGGAEKLYVLSRTPIEDAKEQRLTRILGVGVKTKREGEIKFYEFAAPDGMPPIGKLNENNAYDVRLLGMFPEQVVLSADDELVLSADDEPSDAVLLRYQTYNPQTNHTKDYTTRGIMSLKLEGNGNRWILAQGKDVINWKPDTPDPQDNIVPAQQDQKPLWQRAISLITGKSSPQTPPPRKDRAAALVP